MLKTNENKIVEFLFQCKPGPPKTGGTWRVDHHGEPFLLPGIGGITLIIQVGDPASGWAGDHLEPGVSCIADTHKPHEHPNVGVQVFSCAGNKARVVSGEAKGAVSIGIVVHSDCLLAGHGPGVTTLMTCETPLIKPMIDPQANIADLLGIGTAG